MSPGISVVIPTVGRNTLGRAVSSVGEKADEILVCADTREVLQIPEMSNVKVVRVGPGAGGNAARNVGIREAHSEYVALLDDDDWWREGRVQYLLNTIDSQGLSCRDQWLMGSRCLAGGARVYPGRLPEPDEELIEYLFRARGLLPKKGALVTSTLVFPRSMGLDVPFDEGLRYHQDLDWIVSLVERFPEIPYWVDDDVGVFTDDTLGSVSRSISVDDSVRWADKRLAEFGGKVAGDFMLTRTPLRSSSGNGEISTMAKVWKKAFSFRGAPSLPACVYGVCKTVQGSTRSARDGVREVFVS